ncbi:hypothetical protein HAX54_012043, partial [Datura stramonium]|nr:hypothetical protein [Datura stramonium]
TFGVRVSGGDRRNSKGVLGEDREEERKKYDGGPTGTVKVALWWILGQQLLELIVSRWLVVSRNSERRREAKVNGEG